MGIGELLTLACMAGCALVGLAFFVMFALMVVGTIQKRGRWGIPLKKSVCPRCGKPPPTIRMPKNARMALWGGWVCADCNLELDKWGVPVDG